jgi:S1-C subfamily serine protease
MSITPEGDYQPENPVAPDPAPPKKRTPWLPITVATVAVLCIGGLGTATVAELTANNSTTTSSPSTTRPNGNGNNSPFGNGGGNGNGNRFGGLQGGQSIGQQATADEAPATASTSAQQVGVVTIDTVLAYDDSERAAGTGMILTSNGYILTNNHVVEGSTSIAVTVESTGAKYTATVVGTDTTADVAVLKLTGASGLHSVSFAAAEKVAAGQSIYSVGNAEGTGRLVTAVGTVGAVNQSLTIGSDAADTSEHLTGLIQLNSDVVSGDSGGPLFDKSGKVIGMVTAASSGSAEVTGYAINIAQVLKIADAIEAGSSSTDIVLGYPAFAGINIASTETTSGVPVASTFPGMPAAKAGITTDDTITAVNGIAMNSATQLSAAIQAHKVGDTVTITWVTADGVSRSAGVTLIAGPAA